MTPSTQNELPAELKSKIKLQVSFIRGNTPVDDAIADMEAFILYELQSQQDRILQMVEELIGEDDGTSQKVWTPSVNRNTLRAEQRIKLAQIKEALK